MVAIGCIADKVGLWRALDMTRLTHKRHWLCTAAMFSMSVSALSKCAFDPIQWCLLSLGTLAETIVTAIGLFRARPCGVDRIATKEGRQAPCVWGQLPHAAH